MQTYIVVVFDGSHFSVRSFSDLEKAKEHAEGQVESDGECVYRPQVFEMDEHGVGKLVYTPEVPEFVDDDDDEDEEN